MRQRQISVDVTMALSDYPYFVLRNEVETGYNLLTRELIEIKQNYLDYKRGVEFLTEGSAGDYQPSDIHFKNASSLINKEARFMFSQTPDILIQPKEVTDDEKAQAEQYQILVDKVLERSNFSGNILKSAKDCFIGKRVAFLADYSENDGIRIHFYNALQFYYETDETEKLVKFICFERLNDTKTRADRKLIITRYEDTEGVVYVDSKLCDGTGNVIQTLIETTKTELTYIPAVIVINDGTLEERRGVSDIEELVEYEAGYSRLGNADIDSERKGMNPIRYTVDMESETTKNLSSGAGAYWDLKSDQMLNESHPQIGTLSPSMNHTEAVKTTLERLRSAMHGALDIPDISQEGLLSGITSFKALKALYYPLMVRCDEKLKTWKPAIKFIVQAVIDIALLNKEKVLSMYVLSGLDEVQYNIEVVENYALLDDETEEKELDMMEIEHKTRSRFSYIKKWRKDEYKTDEQIQKELMQIAIEENMFDTMSMNTQVQTELNKIGTKQEIEENIEQVKKQNKKIKNISKTY